MPYSPYLPDEKDGRRTQAESLVSNGNGQAFPCNICGNGKASFHLKEMTGITRGVLRRTFLCSRFPYCKKRFFVDDSILSMAKDNDMEITNGDTAFLSNAAESLVDFTAGPTSESRGNSSPPTGQPFRVASSDTPDGTNQLQIKVEDVEPGSEVETTDSKAQSKNNSKDAKRLSNTARPESLRTTISTRRVELEIRMQNSASHIENSDDQKQDLKNMMEGLRDRIQKLEDSNIRLKELERENAALKKENARFRSERNKVRELLMD